MPKIAGLAACIAMAGASLLATAQDFPAKTIRIVVPFAPGGGSDGIARMLADRMATDLRVSVIVTTSLAPPASSGPRQCTARLPTDTRCS